MTTHLACTSIILCFTAAPLRCARIRGVISDARERANSTLSLALVVFFFYYFSFSSSSSLSSFFLFYFLAKRTTQLFHLIRLTEFESVLKMYDNFCVPFILPPSFVCIATFRVLRCVARLLVPSLLPSLEPLPPSLLLLLLLFVSVAIISHLSRLRCAL